MNTTTLTTLADYQADAAATAEPRAYHLDYLVPGIVGEIGELFGHRAKAYWHQTDRSERIIGEYGDIAWMTALLLKRSEVTELEPAYRMQQHPSVDGQTDGWVKLLSLSNTLFLTHFYGLHSVPLGNVAQSLWATLEARCEEITGSSFQDVLDYNLQKLAARAAKGTLKGDGDGTR